MVLKIPVHIYIIGVLTVLLSYDATTIYSGTTPSRYCVLFTWRNYDRFRPFIIFIFGANVWLNKMYIIY